MVGESRKWTVLIATTWIQAFTGTNFDFSSYSSTLKSILGISQLQLNYLAVASDIGKLFGWCSALLLRRFPLPAVMFMAATTGLFGYGLQWLVVKEIISLPYFAVFLLCLISGCSITWFNTVCFVLCIRNFPTNRSLALSLSVSFNGLSAALYTIIANAIDPGDKTLYLSLNSLLPLLISGLALTRILHQPEHSQPLSPNANHRENSIFLVLNVIAVVSGLYLLLLNLCSWNVSEARVFLFGAVLLLVLPMCLPGIASTSQISSIMSFCLDQSSYHLVSPDDIELNKELIEFESNERRSSRGSLGTERICLEVLEKDQLPALGGEYPAKFLVRSCEFWLYYGAYLCSGTVGLVYSNNLGQITQSLGYNSELNSIITLYSSCSFFGRLLSAAPDFLDSKVHFPRTGWLAATTAPTTLALFLLSISGSKMALYVTTSLIGLSSGFIVSVAISITAELFGPNSAVVNHNILITNIPIGSFLYGILAAAVYDSNAGSLSLGKSSSGEAVVCMGRECYMKTLVFWGCVSSIGLVSGFLLFLRTRVAYDRFRRDKTLTESS